jgi:hypothetical protein
MFNGMIQRQFFINSTPERRNKMKKIILITFIGFSIPYFVFAQGIDIMSTIEGTLWRGELTGVMVTAEPNLVIQKNTEDWMLGFGADSMYMCAFTGSDTCTLSLTQYAHSVIIPSIGLVVTLDRNCGRLCRERMIAMMMPWGVGYMTRDIIYVGIWGGVVPLLISNAHGLLIRESDNWTPPGVE